MRGISKSRSLETSKSKLKFNFEQLLNQLKFQAKQEMKEKKRSIGQIAGKSVSKMPMYTGFAIGSKL